MARSTPLCVTVMVALVALLQPAATNSFVSSSSRLLASASRRTTSGARRANGEAAAGSDERAGAGVDRQNWAEDAAECIGCWECGGGVCAGVGPGVANAGVQFVFSVTLIPHPFQLHSSIGQVKQRRCSSSRTRYTSLDQPRPPAHRRPAAEDLCHDHQHQSPLIITNHPPPQARCQHASPTHPLHPHHTL